MKDAVLGTTADDKEVPQKAHDSIRTNLEFVSNEIDDSEEQNEKHSE
jgi:hypothetical protein